MKREDKGKIIEGLTSQINDANHFYLADISELSAVDTSNLRRRCFKKDITVVVVKNTLLGKALDAAEGDFSELTDTLKGHTSIMFCEHGNVPAKVIKEFRKSHEKPVLKAAYVEETVYLGDDQLEALTNIKSKNELIGDIIGLLQSPVNNVVSALKSGGNTLHGLIETLSNKEE